MWTTIEYTDAVFDEATGRWVYRAEVPFTAFAAQKKAEQVPGRLVVRRIPDFNAEKNQAAGQDTLFDVWRFHAFFTTTDAVILDTVAADKTHRGHAVIEQVHSDLKNSALAHLPSGVFTANAAWLVLAVIAFNLTRAAASLTDPQIAKATTATIRRKLITVPARVATSARRIILHLPQAWLWETAWTALIDRVSDPPLRPCVLLRRPRLRHQVRREARQEGPRRARPPALQAGVRGPQEADFPYVVEVYRHDEAHNEYRLEYCDTTLRDYIATRNRKLGFAARKRIALQFLHGVNYLHHE